jgi:hypothetical protein
VETTTRKGIVDVTYPPDATNFQYLAKADLRTEWDEIIQERSESSIQ